MTKLWLALSILFSPLILANGELGPEEIKLSASNTDQFSIYVFSPNPNVKTDSAIITVHGGGWKWGRAEWTFNASRKFAQAGITSIAVDYRLSNDVITPLDAKEDICTTLNWLRDNHKAYNIDSNKIAAHGVSAGGQLIALATTTGCGNKKGSKKNGGPDLLSLWSPALDMERDGWFKKLLNGKASVKDNSPLATINNNMPDTIIIQGELDSLTPTSSAKDFCQKVQVTGAECNLHIYPAVGHLLTRNLQNQESNFDPDPKYVEDGYKNILSFLEKKGYSGINKSD